jgi:hypothetical protein
LLGARINLNWYYKELSAAYKGDYRCYLTMGLVLHTNKMEGSTRVKEPSILRHCRRISIFCLRLKLAGLGRQPLTNWSVIIACSLSCHKKPCRRFNWCGVSTKLLHYLFFFFAFFLAAFFFFAIILSPPFSC